MSKPITLSIRCHTNVDCSLNLNAHMQFIDSWCHHRSYVITHSSFGIHRESSKPHYHYHLVILSKDDAVLSNPLSTLKYDRDAEKFSFDPSYVYTGDRCMSIRQKLFVDISGSSLDRFLQYPLKEGQMFHSYNINTHKFMAQAMAEFEHVKVKRAKEKHKAELESKRKFALVDFLNKLEWKSYEPPPAAYFYSKALDFYRDHPNHPTLNNIFKEADAWMYRKKLICNMQLIELYRPKTIVSNLDPVYYNSII